MSESLQWTTVKRRVGDLVPYNHNPRILSPEKEAKLRASLEKFNLAEIPAINLDNVLIAGHQRCRVMIALGRADEMIDVRIPNRMLSEAELKEYNITSNIPAGMWDLDELSPGHCDLVVRRYVKFMKKPGGGIHHNKE